MNIEDIEFKPLTPSQRAIMLRDILDMTEKILELSGSFITDREIYKLYNDTKFMLNLYKTKKLDELN